MAAHWQARRNLYHANVIRQQEETSILREIPGLRYVEAGKSSILKRILWLLVTLAAFGLCCSQIVERISYFLDDPSKTDLHYVNNYTLEFPAMVICPSNVYHQFPSINSVLALEKLGKNFTDMYGNKTISLVDLWNISRLGFEKFECFLSDIKEKLDIPSTSIEVSEVFTTAGICIRLVPKRNLHSIGRDTSIKFVAYDLKMDGALSVAHYMAEDIALEVYYSHLQSILYLNDTEFAFHIRLEEVIYRNSNTKPCADGSISNKCLVECLDALILANVSQKCRLPYMQTTPKTAPCTTWKQFEEVKSATFSTMTYFRPKNCNCPRKCRSVLYDIEYSDRWVDSSYSGRKMVWLINIPENMLKVTQEVKLYSAVDLFSDFGGTLGLYLGLCILNVIEITVGSLTSFMRILLRKERYQNVLRKPRRPLAVVVRRNLSDDTNPLQDVAGLRNVLKDNNSIIVRCLWLVVSVVALSSFVYQCSERIAYFLSEPLSTNVYYVHNRTVKLPSFMICPVSTDGFLPAVQQFYVFQKLGKLLSRNSLLKLMQNGTLNIDELWNLSKVHGEVMHNEFITLNVSHILTPLGTCEYYLPKDVNFRDAGQGITFRGIDTAYGINFPQNPRPILHVIYLNHDDLSLMKYLVLHAGMTVNASTMFATLRIGKILNLNIRRNPCTDSETVSKCLGECINEAIISKLENRCRLPFLKYYSSVPPCVSKQETETVINSSIESVQHFKREDCDCPRKCIDVFYTLERTHRISSRYGMKVLLLTILSSNKLLVIQELSAYNAISLLSDIGGCLSLFLGVCGLQILELMSHLPCRIIAMQARAKKNLKCKQQNRTIVIRGGFCQHQEGLSLDIPGFSKILASSNWCGKITWTMISVVALVATTYQCAERINYFLSDSSVISAYHVYNKTILIPTVVQCFLTDVTSIRFGNFGVNVFAVIKYYGRKNGMNVFIEQLNKQQVSIIQLWNLTRREILVKNFWIGNMKADDLIILSEVNTTMGVCALFEPRRTIIYNGSEITLRASVTAASVTGYLRIFYSYSILISNEDKVISPYLLLKYPSPSTGNLELNVRITNVLRRSTANSPCEDGETVSKCLRHCLDKIAMSLGFSEEPCRLPYMQISSKVPICNSSIGNYGYAIRQPDISKIVNEDDCSCPKKCNEISYFIEDLHDAILPIPISRSNWRITIPNNKISVIKEEKAYTFLKLLSDLGGAAGLLFGLGFLQIVEVIDKVTTKFINFKTH